MACMGGKGTQFHKYQGLGNDFILVDHTKGPSALTLTPAEYSFAKYCNRNYGVGADGLIFVMPGQHECDYTMLIYNSDGTQPQMCGNGIRCMARYIHEVIENQQQNFKEVTYKIWTGAGVIIPRLRPDGQIEVDMGYPIFNPSLVPTTLPTTNVMWNEREEGDIGAVVNAPIEICTSTGEKTTFLATAVGFGNPHVVVFVDDLDDMQPVPFSTAGPLLESHCAFPEKVNAEFVQKLGKSHFRIKVWERGAGPTLACGTGACATVVAGVLAGHCEEDTIVTLPGGDLQIRWDRSGSGKVFMTGPAEFVFKGEFGF